MNNRILVVARKEVLDGVRDRRGLLSSLLYSLMGPAVILLVSRALHGDSRAALQGMTSVFALVSAFTGGMSLAMDTLAGERERRSLLPLLINPVSRRELIVGKWLAVSLFGIAGVVVTGAGFGTVGMILPLIPLALFAAALELAISTICRSVKEAHTYLSLLIFLPMGAGMFLVFYPQGGAWLHWLPVVGQEWTLGLQLKGAGEPAASSLLLALTTAVCAILVLMEAAQRLDRDDVIYGE
jgi:sodium transport system permease protein